MARQTQKDQAPGSAPAAPMRRQFQAPKGTRDFYPADMAVRRYIEGVWRQVSINHGFDEVEGPTFEYLDLYAHKSGPGIANELFQVFSGKDESELAELQKSGKAPFALRPEFTPTLARMVAARAAELPRPIKWFAIPSHFRAERPQRGRLREFLQWNVDFIGDESPAADAEVIATAVAAMEVLGLTEREARIRLNHRWFPTVVLGRMGFQGDLAAKAFALLDKRQKMSHAEFQAQAQEIGLGANDIATLDRMCDGRAHVGSLATIADQLELIDDEHLEHASLLEQH